MFNEGGVYPNWIELQWGRPQSGALDLYLVYSIIVIDGRAKSIEWEHELARFAADGSEEWICG